MSIVARFATSRPVLCAVCHRTAWHLGYRPHDKAKLIWLCDDNRCQGAAKAIYNMPTQKLDLYEQKARDLASAECGQFLDEIGCTDLAQLTDGQWREFWNRFVLGYEKHAREIHESNAAPF
jgi:hypothetical protein